MFYTSAENNRKVKEEEKKNLLKELSEVESKELIKEIKKDGSERRKKLSIFRNKKVKRI